MNRSINMPVKGFLLTCIFYILLCPPECKAGDKALNSMADRSGTDGISLRTPQQETIDAYLNNPDYQYGGEYKPIPEARFLKRILNAILRIVAKGFDTIMLLPVILKVLLVLVFLILAFYVFTKTKVARVLYGEQKGQRSNYIEIDPAHEHIDLNKVIDDELTRQNYREVIRLLHLKMLKELDQQAYIRLSADKTNRDYAREITNPLLQHAFSELTWVYNRVWYGKYPVTATTYEEVLPRFKAFSEKVNVEKK
ncbi:MAG: DUF4129 domain-containing protein [Bacteroidales bacterium]|nr:DUF4129 domain-containing protein [Bacteroidales bacterium]